MLRGGVVDGRGVGKVADSSPICGWRIAGMPMAGSVLAPRACLSSTLRRTNSARPGWRKPTAAARPTRIARVANDCTTIASD